MKKIKYYFYISNSYNQVGMRVMAKSFQEAIQIFKKNYPNYDIKVIKKGNPVNENLLVLVHNSL